MATTTPTRVPGWQRLVELGLAVTPVTLAEGLRVSRGGRLVLTVGDVGAWADARVTAEPEQPDEVYELLGLAPGTGNDRDSLESALVALGRLAAGERVDRAAQRAKWRLVALVELVERVGRWPRDGDPDDDLACDLWSACRELWSTWSELLDRPPFFYPDGREVSCYHGRDLDQVLAEYRAWIAAERDRLRTLDDAAAAAGG